MSSLVPPPRLTSRLPKVESVFEINCFDIKQMFFSFREIVWHLCQIISLLRKTKKGLKLVFLPYFLHDS